MVKPVAHYKVPALGELGENLAAQWLQSQGWEILHRRWHCRWGELDIIAQTGTTSSASLAESTVVFVEVKTRSRGNWDHDGVLAITSPKQAKLWQAAQAFLAQAPQLAEQPCRFDVILVTCRALGLTSSTPLNRDQVSSIVLGQPITAGDYQLTLQEHIPSAFDR